jgi:hypothetical protein
MDPKLIDKITSVKVNLAELDSLAPQIQTAVTGQPLVATVAIKAVGLAQSALELVHSFGAAPVVVPPPAEPAAPAPAEKTQTLSPDKPPKK